MKKPSQRDRVRAWLLEHGSITNVEAMQHQIFRLSERIRELQAGGMDITGDWVREGGKKTGTYRYVLNTQPSDPKRQVIRYVERDGQRFAQVSYE